MKELLKEYFSAGIESARDMVGMEVETSYVHRSLRPISFPKSQELFHGLAVSGWNMVQRKGEFLTKLRDVNGNCVLYELGHQNIELATAPASPAEIIARCRAKLSEISEVASSVRAFASYKSVLPYDEDTLAILDERDATWLEVDGRAALAPLARTTSVQFTIDVPQDRAVDCLNMLGHALPQFLEDYPQETLWREYIRTSRAGYEPDRFGGPVFFESIDDYIEKLSTYRIVTRNGLKQFGEVDSVDVPSFVRSVWWYFRLRRNNNRLCLEVRPLPRKYDWYLEHQLKFVLDTINL